MNHVSAQKYLFLDIPQTGLRKCPDKHKTLLIHRVYMNDVHGIFMRMIIDLLVYNIMNVYIPKPSGHFVEYQQISVPIKI